MGDATVKRKLRSVNPLNFQDQYILYRLLSERTPEQSISHKEMPPLDKHIRFVESLPYKAWYMVVVDHVVVGATYLSKQNELGIAISEVFRGQGHARWALEEMMRLHDGPFLANINPKNEASISLFTGLGFNLLQETYSHE